MKENEASVLIGNIPVNGKDGCYSITEYQEAKTVAVQALEEIQQYRAIGTPEECRAAVEKQNRLQKTEHWKISTGTIVNVMWITQLYIAAIRRNQRMSRVLPILFNTEMVRAILDGRKSCTRRIVKPQPQSRLCYTFAGSDCGTWGYPSKTAHESWGDKYRLPDGITDEELKRRWKPPYRVDDILYVRETWQYLYELDGNEQIIEGTGKYYYAATDTIPFDTYVDASGVTHERVPWHPSIHMPKEAARIWLKVTDVRVERLQEITEAGAAKEGCVYDVEYALGNTAKGHFIEIWNSTIKKADLDRYGWDASPWVWVIEFEQCEKPEEN